MSHFICKIFLIFIAFIAMSSCTNDVSSSDFSTQEETSETTELIVSYKGKSYFTKVAFQGDSVIYLNEEFADIYQNEISKIDGLATLMHEDAFGRDVIEYYSNAKELEETAGIDTIPGQKEIPLSVNPSDTRSVTDFPITGTVVGMAQLWDDKDYKDNSVVIRCTLNEFQCVNNMKKAAGFNDKASAIKVWNYLNPNTYYKGYYLLANSTQLVQLYGSDLRICLISYADSDFKGKVLYCVSNPSGDSNPHQDRRLKSIGWNDKISSAKCRVVVADEIGTIITPHTPI